MDTLLIFLDRIDHTMKSPLAFVVTCVVACALPEADAFITHKGDRVSLRQPYPFQDTTTTCSAQPTIVTSGQSTTTALAMSDQQLPPDMSRLQYDITFLQGPQDFLDFLSRDDRLCIVFVRANWCQICKAFSVKWRKMANTYGDKYDPATGQLVIPGLIRFAEIEFTEHEDLCRRLKASRMPHVLFYQGQAGMAGKIVQYQCGPSAFGLVEDSAEYILAGGTQGLPMAPPWEEFVAAQEAMLREKEARENEGMQ